jgi:class 3 adenylate cyclase
LTAHGVSPTILRIVLEPNVKFTPNQAGLHVAYSALGQGPPDLLWVPNFTSHVDAWWLMPQGPRFIEGLADIGRLIQFDQPGTGASDSVAPDALPTMEQWMDDVRVVLDAEGVESATLIAEDSAGPVALLFAASHPGRTRGLVLLNSYARMERAPDYPWGFPPEIRAEGLEFWRRIWGTGDQLHITAPSYANDPEVRRVWGLVERLSASPTMARALFAMIAAIDVREVLPAVRVPTLVLHRVDDPWIRVGHGRYLAEQIPDAEFVELPGDAHYAYAFGDTDEVVARISEFVTGTPREALRTQRVLATLLYTDIVDSTRRAAQLGDAAWRKLLDDHDRLSSRQVKSFRGRIIKSTGDGILASFDGPARAVRCAHAIRTSLRALDIEIRAGLHTGEVELRGEDVGGIAANVAARVVGAAGAGDVLVSQTVKDLTIGSGIDYDDLGAHALKGVPGDWRLYRARA